MSALVCAGLCVLALSQLELRRGAAALPAGAVVTAVGVEGVTMTAPAAEAGVGAKTVVLGWERVRAVSGDYAEQARPFADLADKAWRASVRLERGDYVAAEPVLDELFPAVRGARGPTPAMVCEGLLRCRLRRGAQVGAVDAWLAWLGSRPAGVTGVTGIASMDGADSAARADAGLVDRDTGLAPPLPPVWIGTAGLQVWAAGPAHFASEPRAGALEALYRESAKFECGLPVALPEAAPTDDPAARLAWEMVSARAGDAARRKAARDLLVARLASSSIVGWQEAWCRAAVGRSMLREDAVETRRLGVIQLLHVPARLGEENPYLAGVCLAEGAVELKRQGDEAGAQRLRAELMSRYPDHPAVQWEALRGWSAGKTAGTAGATNKENAAKDAGTKDAAAKDATGKKAGPGDAVPKDGLTNGRGGNGEPARKPEPAQPR